VNLRVTTYLSYEGEPKEIEDLVKDISVLLNNRGFNNDVSSNNSVLKSLIVVKENVEIPEVGANEFFAQELESSLFTVVPAFEEDVEKDLLDDESEVVPIKGEE
jgi:hypothetical protein